MEYTDDGVGDAWHGGSGCGLADGRQVASLGVSQCWAPVNGAVGVMEE